MPVRGAFLVVVLLAAAASASLSIERSGFDRAMTHKKVVALTFDADMTTKMLSDLKSGKVASWYNQKVIATLKQERVPATLFLAGLWIKTYPAVTQELSNDSLFELGNHSYSHGSFRSPCYRLASIPKSNESAEVQRTDELLNKYSAQHKKLFRFPGLCFENEDIEKVEAQGYTVIGGDVDAGDGFQKSAMKIVSNVLEHVRPGSVVILHMHGGPNAPETANALPEIIRGLRSRGYTFVKVSDLLGLSGLKN
jgi:peptidoglycan/xylan/chitin deacetylase (PgdA/CDA1 family)